MVIIGILHNKRQNITNTYKEQRKETSIVKIVFNKLNLKFPY